MSDEVLAALISGMFLLLVAITSILLPRLFRQGRDIAEVKFQVKNSHRTNLRDDLDALRHEMRGGFARVFEHMGEVRTDLLAERAARQQLADVIAATTAATAAAVVASTPKETPTK